MAKEIISEFLTLVKMLKTDAYGNSMGLFRCCCGKDKIIRFFKVKYGEIKSCGCRRKIRTHGEPSKYHQIERKDNDANYCPENCTWVTRKEQCRNRRSSVLAEYNGRVATLAEWNEIAGHPEGTISSRLNIGWSMERAMTTPVIRRPRHA